MVTFIHRSIPESEHYSVGLFRSLKSTHYGTFASTFSLFHEASSCPALHISNCCEMRTE